MPAWLGKHAMIQWMWTKIAAHVKRERLVFQSLCSHSAVIDLSSPTPSPKGRRCHQQHWQLINPDNSELGFSSDHEETFNGRTLEEDLEQLLLNAHQSQPSQKFRSLYRAILSTQATLPPVTAQQDNMAA